MRVSLSGAGHGPLLVFPWAPTGFPWAPTGFPMFRAGEGHRPTNLNESTMAVCCFLPTLLCTNVAVKNVCAAVNVRAKWSVQNWVCACDCACGCEHAHMCGSAIFRVRER